MFSSFLLLLFSISFITVVRALPTPTCPGGVPSDLASNFKGYKPAESYCSASYPVAITTINKIFPPKTETTTTTVSTATVTTGTTIVTETVPPSTSISTEIDTATSINTNTITLTSTSTETDTTTITVINNQTVTGTITNNLQVTVPQTATTWTTITQYNTTFSTQTVATVTATVTQNAAGATFNKRDIVQDQVLSSLLLQGSTILAPMCACMGRTSTTTKSTTSTTTKTALVTATNFVVATQTATITPIINTTLTTFTTTASNTSIYTMLTVDTTTVVTAVETSTTTLTATVTLNMTATSFTTSTETDTSTQVSQITSIIPATAYQTITVSATTTTTSVAGCATVLANGKTSEVYQQFFSGTGMRTNPSTDPGNDDPKYHPVIINTYSGTLSACAASAQCATNSYDARDEYFSFDLHYRLTTNVWECYLYYEGRQASSRFNTPDATVGQAYGYGLKGFT